jgi:hypothetical protein
MCVGESMVEISYVYDTLIKISQHTKSQPLIHPHTSFAPTPPPPYHPPHIKPSITVHTLVQLCKPTTGQPKEKNTSQQPQPRMKMTMDSVDLQSPSEKYVVCF